MAYLEFLRMRKRIVICATILASFALLILVSSHNISGVNGIPLSALVAVAGFVTFLLASFLPSLNALSDSLPSVWTKPIARERIALSLFGVDALGLVAVFAITLVFVLVVLAGLGLLRSVTVDSQVFAVVLIGLGAAFMAYGSVQALTAWQLSRGGMIAGIAFGAYVLVPGLSMAPFPPMIHWIFSTLCIFDPLAYFSLTVHNHGSDVSTQSIFALGIWYRIAIVFAFGIAGLIIATFSWKRMEI